MSDIHGLEGFHNQNTRSREYKDLSTVMVMPTRGVIPARVVQAVWGVMCPMNQPHHKIVLEGMEVGEAYNAAIEGILAHEQLSQWKYVLTVEEDNLPPADGLLKLLESIEGFDAVSGLYFTKGEHGQPQCYGKPGGPPSMEFVPWLPDVPDQIVSVNGIGMGFGLFRLDLFRQMEKPWFKTLQEMTPTGAQAATQDLYFCKNATRAGKRLAVDTRVKVGHLDPQTGMVW